MAEVMQMPPPKADAECPKCGGRAIRIRRKFWDRLSHRNAVGKFECDVCYYRFFLPPPRNGSTLT